MAVRELADRRRGTAPMDRERLHPAAQRRACWHDVRVDRGLLPQSLHVDTVAEIDPGSLEHQGEYALSLARAFAAGELGVARRGGRLLRSARGRLVVYPRSWALLWRRVPPPRTSPRSFWGAAPAGEPVRAPVRRRQQPAVVVFMGALTGSSRPWSARSTASCPRACPDYNDACTAQA